MLTLNNFKPIFTEYYGDLNISEFSVKFTNRRIKLLNKNDRYYIQIIQATNDKAPTCKFRRIKNKLSVVDFNLSREAAEALYILLKESLRVDFNVKLKTKL